MGMQTELRRLYENAWPSLREVLGPIAEARKLSNPLLLDPEAHAYQQSPVRWMAVGRETNGWGTGHFGSMTIDDLLSEYKSFQLGRGYKGWHTKPFFKFLHDLHARLNPDGPQDGFVLSELFKVDEAADTPNDDIKEHLRRSFNVLPEEIRVTSPQAVVFLTSADLDNWLAKFFPGCDLEPIGGYEHRDLARIRHDCLPADSFRTYHPGHLHYKPEKRESILQAIADSVLGNTSRA
ncbi:MAG TPA: hypothetical protein PLP01_04570 [Phycisphaerae bacterium]|nr:hypothetical protein [Phycisphaerae bacterium]